MMGPRYSTVLRTVRFLGDSLKAKYLVLGVLGWCHWGPLCTTTQVCTVLSSTIVNSCHEISPHVPLIGPLLHTQGGDCQRPCSSAWCVLLEIRSTHRTVASKTKKAMHTLGTDNPLQVLARGYNAIASSHGIVLCKSYSILDSVKCVKSCVPYGWGIEGSRMPSVPIHQSSLKK